MPSERRKKSTKRRWMKRAGLDTEKLTKMTKITLYVYVNVNNTLISPHSDFPDVLKLN